MFIWFLLATFVSMSTSSMTQSSDSSDHAFDKSDCVKGIHRVKSTHRADTPIKCKPYSPVFFWDHRNQKCQKGFYGGCHGIQNWFKSFEKCESVARPVCSTSRGFSRRARDTGMPPLIEARIEEVFSPIPKIFEQSDCLKGVHKGDGFLQCRGNFPVFFWDHNTQKCQSDIYGGCNGTPNIFETIEECESVARPICTGTYFNVIL